MLVGAAGGIAGCALGFVSGLFFEVIFRRLREEKSFSEKPEEPVDEGRLSALKELELSPDASAEEIKKAHRTLASRYHPDNAGGDSARFMRIQDAYEYLKP
ncbi:MAG: J domain-containing protein [Treponema sp.]|nr:J domain-containing protein [Treponema sp.]